MIPINIERDEKILVIAPHPDDECIGAGGILSGYSDQCTVWVLTDGSIGQGNIAPQKCREIRKNETERELEYLNVKDVKFFDIQDGTLMNHLDCISNIDLKKFSKIFVTGQNDSHPDHTAAYICIKNELLEQRNFETELYVYEIHKELMNPTHFLDITGIMEKKIAAIQFHESQVKMMPYDKYASLNAELRAIQDRQLDKCLEVYQRVNICDDPDNVNISAETELQKFKQFYQVLTKWMLNEEANNLVNLLLNEYKSSSCVIYGYAELGKILERKLSNSAIKVNGILDKKVEGISYGGITIQNPQHYGDTKDMVIVTATYWFEDIRRELQKLGYERIYSLTEIVMQL